MSALSWLRPSTFIPFFAEKGVQIIGPMTSPLPKVKGSVIFFSDSRPTCDIGTAWKRHEKTERKVS